MVVGALNKVKVLVLVLVHPCVSPEARFQLAMRLEVEVLKS